MKPRIIKLLLGLLNTQWLNPTPCKYEFVGNLDAFSRDSLECEERQQPGITVRELLAIADRFKSCPLRSTGLTVIEGDEVREGTVWDMRELANLGTKK